MRHNRQESSTSRNPPLQANRILRYLGKATKGGRGWGLGLGKATLHPISFSHIFRVFTLECDLHLINMIFVSHSASCAGFFVFPSHESLYLLVARPTSLFFVVLSGLISICKWKIKTQLLITEVAVVFTPSHCRLGNSNGSFVIAPPGKSSRCGT